MRSVERPNQKIRILQLIDTFNLGGAERIVLSLSTKINCDRFDVVPCALFRSGPLERELKAAGVPYRVLGLPRRSVLTGPLFVSDVRRLVNSVNDLVDELSVDIIHAHLTRSTLIAILAAKGGKRIPLCASVHNIVLDHRKDCLSLRNWCMRAGVYALFCRVDYLIAVSPEVSKAIESYTGVKRGRIRTIENGVDTEVFRRGGDQERFRKDCGWPTDRPLLISIGRLTRQKGYACLLPALASIPTDKRPFTVIVGDGPDRLRLEASVTELGLEDDVCFVGTRQDIPELLAAGDFFVLPSLWEGLPLALLEAMAVGLPSVATAVGENTRVIEDGETGFLVPPADPNALRDALTRLLGESIESRRRMGDAARARVLRMYSERRFIESHESLYEEMFAQLSY